MWLKQKSKFKNFFFNFSVTKPHKTKRKIKKKTTFRANVKKKTKPLQEAVINQNFAIAFKIVPGAFKSVIVPST